MSLNADEGGKRLQSWGSPTGDAKADPAQLEAKRLKRSDAQSDWMPAAKRSKGRRHREWSQSFRQGVHPRTGKEGMDKPMWWKDGWWVFQPSLGWTRCSAPDAAPDATAPDATATAPDATAPADATGPKAPEPTPESLERLRLAQEERDLILQEQEQQRHAAEANYGYPTSARPRPIEAPAAKKSSGVPPMSDLVTLYNAASNESKSLAYDAVAKALSSPPEVKPALPVKAMPAVPQEIFMAEMASRVLAALGLV